MHSSLENFKASALWRDAVEDVKVYSVGDQYFHSKSCPEVIRRGWEDKVPRIEALCVGAGPCCLLPGFETDNLFYSDRFELLTLCSSYAEITSTVTSLKTLRKLAALGKANIRSDFKDVARDLRTLGRDGLRAWARTPMIDGFLTTLAALRSHPLTRGVYNRAEFTSWDPSDLPASVREYIDKLGGTPPAIADALVERMKKFKHPQGEILFHETGVHPAFSRVSVVSDALGGFETSSGLYRMPSRYRPLLGPEVEYAEISQEDTAQVLETTGVLFESMTLDEALEAARNLEAGV